MRRFALIAALVGAAFAVAPGVASAFSCGVSLDGFNRPNSADLGSNWALQNSSIGINNLAATNGAATTALATFNPRGANEACVDIASGGANLQYVGIVLRYASLAENVFIKVQDNNSDGTFDRAFYYRGNNGSTDTLKTFDDVTPFSQGRIHVWSKGTKARLDIDTDFDNHAEQSFAVTGITTAGLGNGIGLAIYNGAIADNYRTAPPQTKITKHPAKLTTNHSAKFKFKSSIAGSSFKCKLDGRSYRNCASPKAYSNLTRGKHTFRVKAIDPFGNPDPTPAIFKWKIVT